MGNWICLMSSTLADDRARGVGDGRREPLPGQDRREDEQRVVGRLVLDDDRQEDEVDDHLEERVEDPPDVAEQGIGPALADVRLDEVADEPLSRADIRDALAHERDGASVAGGIAKGCRNLTAGGHRAEGYQRHLLGRWSPPYEALDEALAGTTPGGSELTVDERVIAGQDEASAGDGVDDPVGVGHLRADHLGRVVEVQPGVLLVVGQVADQQDDRPAEEREFDDGRGIVGDQDVRRGQELVDLGRRVDDHVIASRSGSPPGRDSGAS